MVNGYYRILVVGEEPDDETLVSELLRETDGPTFKIAYAASLIDCLDCMGEESFDAILVGIALPDSRGLQAFMTVRVYAPGTPILVWTVVENDPHLALHAMQAGAQDYLVKRRLNGAALSRALEYAILRNAGNPNRAFDDESSSVGVVGAKGGVGTTMLACHLSAELRRVTRLPVLLADVDLYGGQTGSLMKANSPYSIIDAANNLHRLDDNYWAALTAEGLENVSVIRSPGLSAIDEAPSPRRLRHVLRFLRTRYPWVVADLGRLSGTSAKMLKDLSYLLVVSTSDPQSLLETRQVLMKLSECEFPLDRVRLILNRVPEGDRAVYAEVERVSGVPATVLPDSSEALCDAYQRGRLLPEKNTVRRQIMKLAGKLAGLEPPAEESSSFGVFRDFKAALLQRRRVYRPIPLQLPAPAAATRVISA